MEISLNGPNVFLIKTTSGSVICDPANKQEATFVPATAADDTVIVAILRSTPAKSAFKRPNSQISTDTISHPGEYEIGDLGLRGIALTIDPDSKSKSTITSFRVDAEGLAVYMLGLAKTTPDARTVQLIGHIDVLLLDTARLDMDVKELSSIIGALDPSLVLVNGLDAESNEPNAMLKSLLGEAGSDQTRKEPQLRVNLTRSAMPENREVIVLRSRA